ncbi:MAG TPA: hypothetical protein VGD64_08865 [Acidisarcina sp.]
MQLLKFAWKFLLDNGGIIMSTVSGLFAYFQNRFKGKLAKVLPIVGVFAGLIWSLLLANNSQQEQRDKLEQTLTRVDNYIQQQGKTVVQQVDVNTRAVLNDFITQIQGAKPSVVQQASLPQVEGLIKAGQLASISAKAIQPDRRQRLTIWVFPHVQQEVDYAVVKARLETIAAQVVPHDLKQKIAPTNSVWFGGGATLEEAKAVALTASGAGLEIRQICPAQLTVPNLLQLGGSTHAVNLPVLSPSQINLLAAPTCE